MKICIALIIMAIVTYAIRMIPFTFFKKKIKSKFLYTLLSYIPYSVLTAMIFPSIFYSTSSLCSAAAATVFAITLSLFKFHMISVSILSVILVFVIDFIIL